MPTLFQASVPGQPTHDMPNYHMAMGSAAKNTMMVTVEITLVETLVGAVVDITMVGITFDVD